MAGAGAITDITVEPFTEAWIPAVKAFNQRLVAGGLSSDLTFPESPLLEFPQDENSPIRQEPFVAVQNEFVRGAFYFTHEWYQLAGSVRAVANYRHPISEVVVNKAFKGLASRLLADARSRQPLLYAIGFGSDTNPNLKRLVSEGWSWCRVPFLFRIEHANEVLRNVQTFRSKPLLKAASTIARITGAGSLGIGIAQGIRTIRGAGISAEVVEEFGPWADTIWEASRTEYVLAAVRDQRTLNLRYGSANRGFIRLRVDVRGQTAGWVVLLTRQMKDNKYFGDLFVGTVVDCFALPGQEPAVMLAAVRQLKRERVDLIVTNLSSAIWRRAASACGFWNGPSNYIYAASAELVERAGPLTDSQHSFHLTRGDGAGISRL